jgi:hypothetical protein
LPRNRLDDVDAPEFSALFEFLDRLGILPGNLGIKPELQFGAEGIGDHHGQLRRKPPAPSANIVDDDRGHPEMPGKRPLRNSPGNEEVVKKIFAGERGRHGRAGGNIRLLRLHGHGYSPSMPVIDDLDVFRPAFVPPKHNPVFLAYPDAP